jgi:hypothetical protein
MLDVSMDSYSFLRLAVLSDISFSMTLSFVLLSFFDISISSFNSVIRYSIFSAVNIFSFIVSIIKLSNFSIFRGFCLQIFVPDLNLFWHI